MFHRVGQQADSKVIMDKDNKAQTEMPRSNPIRNIDNQTQSGYRSHVDNDTERSEIRSASSPIGSLNNQMPEDRQQHSQNRQPETTATSYQRKDTQTMSPEQSEKSNSPQGGYQPTPAQPASRIDIPGSRPVANQPAASATAPRAGIPYGTSQQAYSPTPAGTAKETAGNKRLQIGPGITLSGEIEDCEYLYVEGTVEAALKGASNLEIAESGAFYGTVEIDEARIAGRFEGDLTVRGRLTIEASGSITGSIAYKELAVEAGATLDGKLTPIDGKGNTRVTEGSFGKGKNKKAQVENELPFSDTRTAVNAE